MDGEIKVSCSNAPKRIEIREQSAFFQLKIKLHQWKQSQWLTPPYVPESERIAQAAICEFDQPFAKRAHFPAKSSARKQYSAWQLNHRLQDAESAPADSESLQPAAEQEPVTARDAVTEPGRVLLAPAAPAEARLHHEQDTEELAGDQFSASLGERECVRGGQHDFGAVESRDSASYDERAERARRQLKQQQDHGSICGD